MAIAALFGANAQEYQQISAQAAAYLAQFVAALTSGGGWYARPPRPPTPRWHTKCSMPSMRPPRHCWPAVDRRRR
nr:PE family protein [Mycobacterium tuberculosis]